MTGIDLTSLIDPLWGWTGVAIAVVVGCVAVAMVFPPLRGIALAVGAAAIAALSIYAKGSRDAAKRKQAQWDKAERDSIKRGNKARSDAKRDVDAGRVRDPHDRDDI